MGFANRLKSLTTTAVVVAAAVLAGGPARAATAAASAWFVTDQGQVRLVAAQSFVGDDSAIELGLEFRLAPHWKIYWRSPGDAGYPPRLDWTGSDNLAGAEIAWPAPQRFSVLGLETVGYQDSVVLPIRARVTRPGAPLALHATLDYLTCAEICVPYQTELALVLPATPPAPGVAGFGPLIARWEARVPDSTTAGLAVTGATLRPGERTTLDLTLRSDRPLAAPDAFVEGADRVAFDKPEITAAGPDATLLRLGAHGKRADLAALVGAKLEITLVDGDRAIATSVVPVEGAPAFDPAKLWPMLAIALLGGLILNVMPCVLPVLSLKLLGAIEQRDRAPRAVRAGFLATAAGILLSFLALALAMIALTRSGAAVGWGMQFQEPLFLAVMVALLTLFAANLWGLYEIALPRPMADFASRAALGNVATGAFATLLATPCSAPFLGTAVGFALASGPFEIIAVFLALGIGFAAPYLVVAAVPLLATMLPRPGRWMLAVRRLLGVALAGTALWLVAVLAGESGTGPAVAVLVLMAALVAWLAVVHAKLVRRGVATALVAAALAVTAFWQATPERAADDALWRPFDYGALAPLVQDGQIVFVDVTADWCLTCKVNERLVLEAAPVHARLAAAGVVAMRADWTRPDAAIAQYLRRFGRYGIPFNAVYGPGAPAGVALPEILTEDAVQAALRKASGTPDGRG